MTFFSPDHFKWTTDLIDNWTIIRDEFEHLHEALLTQWHEVEIYSGKWDVFGLWAFGQKIVGNCELCPVTTDLVTRIPGMTTAGFSILRPDTHILPHVGYTDEVLRFHLGLVVPDDCALRVESETRQWTNGSAMVFDDTKEHEAWNRSDESRTILLVDFTRPDDMPDRVIMETTQCQK